MIDDAYAFIKQVSKPKKIEFLDNIETYQAEEIEALWKKIMDLLGGEEIPPPFWAFVWAGGIGLSRYILDNPNIVSGKRVLDFASGSGIVAISALKSKAKKVTACDIDPLSIVALEMNANLNDVNYKIIKKMNLTKAPKGFDIILAGDVCYDPVMSHEIIKWLRLCSSVGIKVIIGDPGRIYLPTENMKLLAEYIVPTFNSTEYTKTRNAQILEVEKAL